MRLVRALAAAVLLAALLVGVPYLLLAWGRWDTLLSADWLALLTRPDDGQVLLGLLTVAGWPAWGLVAITTVLEGLAALTRHRVSLRLPGTGWLRPGIATLIAAVTLTPATALAAPSAYAAPPPTELGATEVAAPEDAPPTNSTAQRSPGRSYTVQAGDELWDIAERELGAGDQWRQILALNPGLAADTRLVPGRQIALPPLVGLAEQGEGTDDENDEAPRTVTVGRGDSLWAIAKEHLGDPHRWTEIYELNREAVADPDEIEVGWQLRLPAPRAEAVHPEEPGRAAPEPGVPEAANPPTLSPDALTPDAVAQDPVAKDPVAQEPGIPEAAELPTLPLGPLTPESVAQDPSAPTAHPSPATPEALPTEPPGPRRSAAQPTAPAEDAAPTLDALPQDDPDAGVGALLGSMGAVLAAGLTGGLAGRRRIQALGREMGRRIVPLGADLGRFWTALVRRGDQARQPDQPCPPTAWLAGWTPDGEEAYLDLEARGATFVAAPEHLAQGLLGTAITSLLCAPWSEEVSLVIADAPDSWADAVDDPAVAASTTAEALDELATTIAERRIELGTRRLDEVRDDAALASSWAPVVFVFCRALTPREIREVEHALGIGRAGISVLAAADGASREQTVRLESGRLVLGDDGRTLTPQLVDAPARRAIVSLFAATGTQTTEPAPWWADQAASDPGPTPSPLPRRSAAEVDPMHKPTLLLLGDVSLEHATGPPPSRARTQCIEYCAWLLQHPGATAPQMQQGLLVAEGTRRSNMSRLRTWLGAAPDGERYLPDAYSGRIELHPSVSSDWERFEALISGGVNLASSAVLVDALTLVRGTPLADVSFQWPWAEDLRATMEGTIVDAACVLFDRSLTADEAQTAQWALSQGQRAAPLDENLASREVQFWAHQGDRQRADQAVLALTRAARAAGRDLRPTTVARIQQALRSFPADPGRIRA